MSRVVVIGAGYGGAAVAGKLDATTDVTVVEPRDAFVHNVAALRALVDPAWSDRIFLPYDNLLSRGTVHRDRAERVGVDERGAPFVQLGSGRSLEPDVVVLASGSTYPFPAKFTETARHLVARRLADARDRLSRASHVLLLGAGPVGLELAGEITAHRPGTAVSVLDPHEDLLGGAYPQALRDELRRQLRGLGVTLLLGQTLPAAPPTAPGQLAGFSVTTSAGTRVDADLWFPCHGVVPAADYLDESLAGARTRTGSVRVDAHLRLPRQPRVYALGDLTDLDEAKTAKAAGMHAEVVAANITAQLAGRTDRTAYSPGAPSIALPLGPGGGASYSETAGVLGASVTAEIKGAHLRIDDYRRLLGLPTVHPSPA